MSQMTNSMDGLLSFQQALNTGMPVNMLDADYIKRFDEIDGKKRYCYARIVDREIQALVTFGQEEPIKGVDCYSVNYSVSEKYRGRGLAVEAVNKGIEELKKEFSLSGMKRFIVDAIIDVTNISSIKVAKKLFPGPGKAIKDYFTGVPSLYFDKLIVLQ